MSDYLAGVEGNGAYMRALCDYAPKLAEDNDIELKFWHEKLGFGWYRLVFEFVSEDDCALFVLMFKSDFIECDII